MCVALFSLFSLFLIFFCFWKAFSCGGDASKYAFGAVVKVNGVKLHTVGVKSG